MCPVFLERRSMRKQWMAVIAGVGMAWGGFLGLHVAQVQECRGAIFRGEPAGVEPSG